jgi:DNA-binding response OmpR family regulator
MSPESDRPAVILVADDDEDILDLVCLSLEQAGHETLRAGDGDEALRLAREHHPDLCVLDVVMPGRTGIEVVKSLRNDPETAGIPVLLLTATVQEKELLPGLDKGGDFYLGKPFSPRELKARVGVLLDDR